MKTHTVSSSRLIELHQSGLGSRQIAEITGLRQSNVCNRLTRAGVTLRGKANHVEVTHNLLDIVDGLLLGDGCMTHEPRSGSLILGQCERNVQWVDTVATRLRTLGVDGVLKTKKPHHTTPTVQDIREYRSKYYREFRAQRDRWYPDGKKAVPADISVEPEALALWYFGDGNVSRGYITLSTYAFGTNGAELLRDKLHARYGWTPRIHKGPIIRLCRRSLSQELIEVVRPYAPKCFDYRVRDVPAYTRGPYRT